MKCPFCQSEEIKVVDKRDTDTSIRRRRECLKCEQRWTTHEKIEDIPMTVIKKDNTRRPYERTKLRNGIIKACEKRPVSLEQIEEMVDEIEAKLRSKGVSEFTTSSIGDEVMKQLKKVDKVAYIRFASVYREFADIEDFKDAIKKL